MRGNLTLGSTFTSTARLLSADTGMLCRRHSASAHLSTAPNSFDSLILKESLSSTEVSVSTSISVKPSAEILSYRIIGNHCNLNLVCVYAYLSVLVDSFKTESGQLWFVKEASLCEEHARVVRRQVMLQEVDTMLLQRRDCILLG